MQSLESSTAHCAIRVARMQKNHNSLVSYFILKTRQNEITRAR